MPAETIIALSAAVQALAAVILVWVTARYVFLTKHLVDTGREQLSDARAILEAQTGIGRAHLRVLVSHIKEIIGALPKRGVHENESLLRRSAIWSEQNEEDLVSLSASLSEALASQAQQAVSALVWIRGLHSRMVGIDERAGYGRRGQEEKAYEEHHAVATKALAALESALFRP